MSGRRIVFLSIPIEALLDILSGRATARLPDEVPSDIALMYSFIEPDTQVLKMAVSHEKFDPLGQVTCPKIFKILVEMTVKPKEEKPEGYTGETLIGTEQWHRDV
jgi:hypothetical protein